VFYNQLKISLEEDSRIFFQQRVDSWTEHDCSGYLKLAKMLKTVEDKILSRVFEDRHSAQFIKASLTDLFYNEVLKSYCPVLLNNEKGFLHLFSSAEKEVNYLDVISSH